MDFQARRANICYRPAAGARPELAHTLNGLGLAKCYPGAITGQAARGRPGVYGL